MQIITITIPHVYVARCRVCQGMICATYDRADSPDETADTVASWIRRGHTVQRMSRGEAETRWAGCCCEEVDTILTEAGVR